MSNPAPLTRNVTAVFRTASRSQVNTGLAWYFHSFARVSELAARHGVSREVAAGVVSALSPLNSWAANVKLADRFLAEGGLTEGYLGVGLKKANRILAGEDVLAVLKSEKVSAFYSCILLAGETDEVCVDRHALDLAINRRQTDDTRTTPRGKRYVAVADTYRRAARILSKETGMPLYAAQVQAVTWVTWRNRYWAEGAFDPR